MSHDVALLDAVHGTFEETNTVVLAADAAGVQDDILTVRFEVAAACVTEIVLVIPPPVIVIVPVLEEVPVFAEA